MEVINKYSRLDVCQDMLRSSVAFDHHVKVYEIIPHS
jgi:hypothetical protein